MRLESEQALGILLERILRLIDCAMAYRYCMGQTSFYTKIIEWNGMEWRSCFFWTFICSVRFFFHSRKSSYSDSIEIYVFAPELSNRIKRLADGNNR